MVQSKVNICNAALAHLGVDPIMTLEDNLDRARRCKQVYDILEMELLRRHDWAFASSEGYINVYGTRPFEDAPYRFDLPVECLALREVCSDRPRTKPVKYWLENGKIYTFEADETVYIRYTKYTSSMNYDAGFTNVLALEIAAALAKPVTGRERPDLLQAAARAYSAAVGADNRESGPPTVRRVSSWLNAR